MKVLLLRAALLKTYHILCVLSGLKTNCSDDHLQQRLHHEAFDCKVK